MVEAVPGNAGRADYPRMLYHPDGRQITVQTPGQHQAHLEQGFSQTPMPVHHERPATHSPMLSNSDPLAILVRNVIEHVLDERGLTKDWVKANTPKPAEDEPPQLELSKRRM